MTTSYLGLTLAFSSSLFWTFSPLFFSAAGRRIGSYYVNILRLTIAAFLLGVIAAIYAASKGNPGLLLIPWKGILWLTLSGASGLVIGDAFYLKALTMIGPRRMTQLFTLGPLFSTAIAWMLLDERLTWLVVAGIAILSLFLFPQVGWAFLTFRVIQGAATALVDSGLGTVVADLAATAIRTVEWVHAHLHEARANLRKGLLHRCASLMRVVRDDLEADAQGRLVIAEKVARDRLISLTDPQARHGRKSQ